MEDRSEDGGLPSDGSRARVESRTASVREATRRRTRVARRRRNTRDSCRSLDSRTNVRTEVAGGMSREARGARRQSLGYERRRVRLRRRQASAFRRHERLAFVVFVACRRPTGRYARGSKGRRRSAAESLPASGGDGDRDETRASCETNRRNYGFAESLKYALELGTA